jgi:hypothetical protein
MQDRTLHGTGHVEAWTPVGGSLEPKFVALGPRIGSSGQVFETHERPDLVVKLFTWAAGLPAEVVREFTRDVIGVANLHHPNIAQVLDAGMLGDGTPFVVMERFAGMTLDEAASGRSLPIAEVLPILHGVGSALSAVHAAGFAHGQVRADNLFIASLPKHGQWCPKLLDFGVARLAAEPHEIGQGRRALGQRAAERADQLALATLAWRLLGPTSAPIQLVLLRAMSPDPSQRFASVSALVEALEEASVTAAAIGPAANAGAVRTLAGPSQSMAAGRVPPAIVVARPSTPAAPPPLPSVPTPVPPSAPSSLTQQFFAEGEQLEIAHRIGHTNAAASGAEPDDEGGFESAVPARVPRSRAQMTAAAFLALGSVGLIVWTIVSLAHKPEGGLEATGGAPPALLDRPVATSPAGALRPARTTDRGPGRKMIQARRTPSVQPPPFAAPAKPSAAASEAPAPGRSDVSPMQAPRPWVESVTAATDGTSGSAAAPDEPLPSTTPTEANDDETQRAEQAGDEMHHEGSAASTAAPPTIAPPEAD